MLNYIDCAVKEIKNDRIVAEINSFAFDIFVINSNSYAIGECSRIYLHEHFFDCELNLYGFKEQKEREVFKKLILVNGIGPKSAMTILHNLDFRNLIYLIKNKDLKNLEKVKGIGSKANLLVNILWKRFSYESPCLLRYNEVHNALKELGYQDDLIYSSIEFIPDGLSDSEALKMALKKIQNG